MGFGVQGFSWHSRQRAVGCVHFGLESGVKLCTPQKTRRAAHPVTSKPTVDPPNKLCWSRPTKSLPPAKLILSIVSIVVPFFG